MNTFFKGTVVLIIATFFGECIEFLTSMVLADELGKSGLGLYMSILPTIFLIVLLASFELPISISKFIAEKEERFHKSMLQHALRLTIIFTSVMMTIGMVLIPFIPAFHQYHPLLRWLVFILIPLISFSSIARGLFMGKNQMGRVAIAQFLRKIGQLILLVLFYQLFDFDMETSLLIAFCTLVGSEALVFIYLFHMFLVQYNQMKKQHFTVISGRTVRKSLMAVSIPTTAIRMFHSLTHAVQPFLIKAALLKAGVSEGLIMEQFGVMAGIAMTIGFFPAFIAQSLLIVLIPTVSKAYADRDYSILQKLLQQVMQITFSYGVPVSIAIYFFGDSISQFFFHSTAAAEYLQLLWPYFLLHFFIIPLQAYLIGLGLMKDAFLHNIWSSIITFSVMYILGSLPDFQMHGIIIGLNAGSVLLTLMHYLTICKKIGVTFWLKVPERKFIDH